MATRAGTFLVSVMYGALTLYGALFQGTCTETDTRENHSQNYNSSSRSYPIRFELFPLHSPLLRESWLVSFPPLNDMLKFSGFPCLI